MTTALADRTIDTFTKTPIEIPDELTLLADDEQPQPGQSCFRIMSQRDGDKRIVWCRNSIPEISAAKETFDRLIKEGMVPYRVGLDGRLTSDVMTQFDALAEEVIFMPVRAIVGG